MTTVPETILCKQMKIPFATIAANVNYAEGLTQRRIVEHERTLNMIRETRPMILRHRHRIYPNVY